MSICFDSISKTEGKSIIKLQDEGVQIRELGTALRLDSKGWGGVRWGIER
jgi:hypothetical protein